MESQIRMASGEVLEIPPRLVSSFETLTQIAPLPVDNGGDVNRSRELLLLAEKHSDPEIAAAIVLKAAGISAERGEPDQVILCLGTYARKQARIALSNNEPLVGLGFVADALELVDHALVHCRPVATRELTRLLAQLSEEALRLCALVDGASLPQVGDDVTRALSTAATVWGPDLGTDISNLLRVVPGLLEAVADGDGTRQDGIRLEQVMQDLSMIRDAVSDKKPHRGKGRMRVEIVRSLVDSWVQIVQEKILVRVNTGKLVQ